MTTTQTAPPLTVAPRWPAGAALLAAQLLLVVGNLVGVDGDGADMMARLAADATGEQLSIVAFLAAFTLLIGGVVGLVGLVPAGRGRGLAVTGAGLFVAGAMGFAGLTTSGVFNIGLARSVPPDQAVAIADSAGSTGAGAVVVGLGLLALPLGLILTAFGVWRAGVTPLWAPIVVLVAFVVLTVAEGRIGGIAGDALLLLGLAPAARGLLRRWIPTPF